MLCHADSTHSWQHAQLTARTADSWQHAQLTANDFPSQLIQLIKKFADQLISHAADSFWWFPTQQKDSADFLRFRQRLIQHIFYVADSFGFGWFQMCRQLQICWFSWFQNLTYGFRVSWFSTWQKASDSADFLRDRHLQDSADLTRGTVAVNF